MLNNRYFKNNFIFHVADWEKDTSVYIMKKDGSSMIRLYWENNDDAVYISDLHVDERCRNKGYASDLMLIAEEIAKNKKCKMLLLTADSNSWMYKWYKKLGFKSIGRKKERLMKKEFEYDN